MDDPTTTILSSETQELIEARDAELRNVLKLRLIINKVRCLNLGPQESAEVRRALKFVSIGDFVRLGEGDREQEHLLDLQDYGNCPPLSYTDRKAVRSKLIENLRATLTPIADMADKMRAEWPDLFAKDSDEELSTEQQEILRLETEYREHLEKLVKLRSRKCALMKAVAELKLGPYLGHQLESQQAQAQLLQTKAELLRGFFINEIVSRTEHSLKAHKEVEKYIDELLDTNKSTAEATRR
ncbi:augmin complex subunit dgt2 [Scaptodrosophila lebanonensis]|uniref:Augmin complex subunit dgt2 n=1 Tax=Drosophila lebanonensis TaxID=7225 RepID=A0A6J2U7L9_DROLE|nr:augmin complex subunit dgt2 [Scaptodrosophila lebanonensis]